MKEKIFKNIYIFLLKEILLFALFYYKFTIHTHYLCAAPIYSLSFLLFVFFFKIKKKKYYFRILMWWISKPTNTSFSFSFSVTRLKKTSSLLCLIFSPNQTRERPASITSPEIRLYSYRNDCLRCNLQILIIFAPHIQKWTWKILNNWGFCFCWRKNISIIAMWREWGFCWS